MTAYGRHGAEAMVANILGESEMTAMKLREAREAAGLSMKQAAELSGTPYRTWQSWETEGRDGRRPPGIAFKWLEMYAKLHPGA